MRKLWCWLQNQLQQQLGSHYRREITVPSELSREVRALYATGNNGKTALLCHVRRPCLGLGQPPYTIPSFLPQWLDSSGWALAFSTSLIQASLLSASVHQFLVFKIRFSRSSVHLSFGLPFLRAPMGWALKTFLVVRSSSILTT
ncbi:hypothetical protein TNCV_1172381 [Trichonephila clavipes]|uniref:Uncharacterized protein n=1 Tax=Trichonephila clavipes TaxID=2585209 RepID=A0A8X6VCW4_TRICX|nr:hypothetical protein TNCV_1172381 [Trichonephila clavipes]